MSRYIIENPGGGTSRQRYGQGVFGLLGWVLFTFLLTPLLTATAWVFGGYFFADVMLVHEGYRPLMEVFAIYLAIIALLGLVLIGWACYNLLRFRHNERRTRHPAPVAGGALAAFYAIDEELVRRWQTERRVVMGHDEYGGPEDPDNPFRE